MANYNNKKNFSNVEEKKNDEIKFEDKKIDVVKVEDKKINEAKFEDKKNDVAKVEEKKVDNFISNNSTFGNKNLSKKGVGGLSSLLLRRIRNFNNK